MFKVGDKIKVTDDVDSLGNRAISSNCKGMEGIILILIGDTDYGKDTVEVKLNTGSCWYGEMNKHFFLIAQPDVSIQQNTSSNKTCSCPLCGTQGEDIIFAFYCQNQDCKNFKEK